MFLIRRWNLKFYIYAFVILTLFVVTLLLQRSVNQGASVTLLNLTNYILKHEVPLQDHSDWKKDCSQKYGTKMILDWKSTRIDVCAKGSNSQISCYTRYDAAATRHLCLLINTKVRLYEPYYKINSSDVSLASNIIMSSDIVSADCEPKILNVNRTIQLVEGYDSLIKIDEFKPSRKLNLQCDHNITHTVFWIWRWDTTNAYHFMEDIMNTFVSLLLLDEDPDQVEIVIYDGKKGNINNPLFTLWTYLFPKGIRFTRNNPFPKNTCFSRSITSMYGIRSHFTEYGGYKTDTHCSSPILKGFRDWTTDKLQMKYNISVKNLTLLFISRQQYLTERYITRVLKNEDAIIKTIKGNYPSLNVVVFRPENYMTFKEQIEIVSRGNIMIGVHGAGLVYSLFMTPGSHLIEIFTEDRNSLNRHFHNIAAWMDLEYQSIEFRNVVPPKDIVRVIDKAVKNLSY